MAVLVLALIGSLLACDRAHRGRSAAEAHTGTDHASLRTIRFAGKTQAVRSRSIQVPILTGQQMNTLTVTYLAPAGARVRRGDMLVEFDQQSQLRDYMDKKADADDQQSKVQEEQAKEDAAKAKDETEIEQAETSLQKAQLEMQKKELLSRIDAEKAQETLDEAGATLAQLKETFALKRKAAQASIRILEIQHDRTREAMLHAKANAALMQIRSPIDGVVVLNTIWKNGNFGEVQVGDQVRGGNSFMEVVDPSAMEVHVKVNQEDLNWLKVGEQAIVRLDAYPQLKFSGQLESIDPMGQNGDFSALLRTFSATFSIEGADPRLMPDLSAAVDLQKPQTSTTGNATK